MKKTLAIFAAVAFALFSLSLHAEEIHYYLRGSDTGSNCALDGNGSTAGWATTPGGAQAAKGATDANGIYHITGQNFRVDRTLGAYTFNGHELVFDGVNPSLMSKMSTGSGNVFTIPNLRVKSGSFGEFRSGTNDGRYLAGTNWVVETGATLGLSASESGGPRNWFCSATITGGGTVAAVHGANDTRGTAVSGVPTTASTMTLSGDLSGFTGYLLAGGKGNTCTATPDFSKLTLAIAAATAFPQATPDGGLLERSIIVTNGAKIAFSCSVTSPVVRGWDFGDGAVPTVDVASGCTVTILGPVKGSTGLQKTGSGTLVLNLGGDYADPITLASGTQTLSAQALAAYVADCDIRVPWLTTGNDILVESDYEANGLPDTGLHTGLTAGTHTFTAPASVALNEGGSRVAFCMGWSLYSVADGLGTLARTSAAPNAGEDNLTCIIDYAGTCGYKLVWNWEVRYAVADAAGTTQYVAYDASGSDASAPVLSSVTISGLGGDAIVASGSLSGLSASCIVQAYLGSDPAALVAYPSARTTIAADGAFSVTLATNDASSDFFLEPGTTRHVSLCALSDGHAAWTVPASVTLAAAPVFASPSASVSRRTVTFTGRLSDLGAGGAAAVTLYAGASSAAEANLEAIEGPVTVTSTSDSFTFTHTFPAFEASYKWQMRAVATTAATGTSLETRTAVATVATKDTTTYTWTGAGADNKWSNPDNWTDNQGGDAAGYPGTANATARFATDAVVDIDVNKTIASLNLAGHSGIDVVFTSADTVNNRLTLNGITLPLGGSTWTLDNAYVYRGADLTPNVDTKFLFRNGAYFYCYSLNVRNAGVEWVVGENATNSVNGLYIGGGATCVISNGYMTARGSDIHVGNTSTGGGLLFKGRHPALYSAAAGGYFRSNIANPATTLGFEVPEGGYDAPPITCVANKSRTFFDNANSAGITIKILGTSGALTGSATTATTLVRWNKGYSSYLTYAPLPTADLGSAFAIENTTDLNVTIYPGVRADRLTVVSDYGTPSPASGHHDGYASGAESTLSAGPVVQVSATERIVPTGWRLYSVDPGTGDRTLVDSGDGDTLAYIHPGSWTAVEWVWRRDFAAAATDDGNGTATLSGAWADEDATLVATATPNTGYRFSYWSGDIVDVSIFDNPAKVPGGRARSLVANFVPADTEVVRNSYSGAKDGSWNTDSNWSLGHVPTAEEIAVIPSDKGTVKITNAGRCAGLVLINSSSLQLLGSGTVPGDQIRLDVRGNVGSTGSNITLGSDGTSLYDVLLCVGGDLCISNNNRTSSLVVYAGDAYGTKSNAIIASGYWGDASSPRLKAYHRGGAQVRVGGRLYLGGTHASNEARVLLNSHYKTGMSAVFHVGSAEIAAHGRIYGDPANSRGSGWRTYDNGYFGLGVARANGGGASYGGMGGSNANGNEWLAGPTFGYAKAPYWPGSAGGRAGNDGGHGGGLLRLHATGDVILNGTINVNGQGWWSNSSRGGGSGGGVWITCANFIPGANAKITAKGGGHSIAASPAGGGGRVAVAAGCTSEADIETFLATGDCPGYIATDFTGTLWPDLVNVAGGVNTAAGTHYDWNDGAAGTALYLQNANGKSPLYVRGNPVAYGESVPAYADHVVNTGDIACETSAYAYVPGSNNGSRYIADGYVWTNSVTDGAGSGTTATIPANGDTTLVWLWRDLEHSLVATSGGHGSVSSHPDWVADGGEVTMTATPDAGANFIRWTGDIEPEYASMPSITVTMDAPRRLIAIFDVPGAASRSLTYSGGDWFDLATWDGVAIPGTNDAVTVSSPVAVTFGATIDVGSLAVHGTTFAISASTGAANPTAPSAYTTPTKFSVSGDFAIDGASSVTIGTLDADLRTDIVVGGTLSIGGSTTMHVYSSVGEADDALRTWRHYKAGGAAFDVAGDIVVTNTALIYCHSHGQSGVGVVWHAGGSVVIGESAQLNGSTWSAENSSYGYGWRYPYAYTFPASGAGSHGGAGGNKTDSSTYGYAYAPFYPGSPGNGNKSANKGEGGGNVRIAAGGNITLLGKIYMTGGINDGSGNNAGAAGSVWLTCDSFTAGSSALINARGGRSNQHSSCGGGGGGRVAIITGSPSEEQINSLYATGAAEDLLVVAEDMNDELVSPWPSLVDVRGGENNDQRANLSSSAHGKPGTAVYLQNAAGRAVVTVTGNQDTTETVPAYGQSTVDTGEQIFTAPAFIYFNDGRSRYPCLGYEWEDAAGNTGSGATTNFTLDVRRDITVTWHWGTLEHFLDIRDGGFCTVSYEAQGANAPGWYDVGTVVRVTCVPEDSDTTFDAWLGDVADAVKGNLAIDVTVDAPKIIVATLHRDAARARTLIWTGEAGDADWHNKANWDGAGIPGKFDAVLVTNGTFQVQYPCAIEVASFAVSNAAAGYVGCQIGVSSCYNGSLFYTTAISPDGDSRNYSFKTAGDFIVSGTSRLYFGGAWGLGRMDMSVGGDLLLDGSSSSTRLRLHIYAGRGDMDWTNLANYRLGGGSLTVAGAFTMTGYAEFTPAGDHRSGATVPVKAGSFSLGANARIDADGRGFGRTQVNPGTGWVLTVHGYALTGTNNRGGTYGGQGGYNDTASFGYEAAPFYPGGAGRSSTGESYAPQHFSGGGAVRIKAKFMTIDGTINANGKGEYQVGGGAGGGIWLLCDALSVGPRASLNAKGGSCSYGGTGGGGGGRIAIGYRFSAAQLGKLYERGFVSGMEVTPLSEIVAGTALFEKYGIDWTGRYSVALGVGPGDGKSGTVGTAVFVKAPAAGTMVIMR